MAEKGLEHKQYYGLHYLRAIMITAIVVWHSKLLGDLSLSNISYYQKHPVTLSIIICFQFFLLAVPTFFLMSLFLFSKSVRSKKYYLFSRLEKLGYSYLFWSGLFVLSAYRCELSTIYVLLTSNINNLISFIAGEGIGVFYFYFSLMILMILSFFCTKLSRSILWVLSASSVFLFWVIPVFVITHNPPVIMNPYDASIIVYWNPLNFFPYAFIASLVAKYFKDDHLDTGSFYFKAVISLILLIFIGASVCEWLWIIGRSSLVNSGYIPPYMRISVAAGATFLFLISFYIKREPGRLISFLSDYSLGIFCLHTFVMGFYLEFIGTPPNVPLFFIYAMVLSSILAYLARRAFSIGVI